MTNLVSPGVLINEFDLTTTVPNLSSTVGAFAGVMRWGPVQVPMLIGTETILWRTFGKPTNFNPETWFTAANFLSYATDFWVVRCANNQGRSPIVNGTVTINSVTITSSNTSALSTGMILIAVNNATVTLGATIASIVNSTAFTIDTASHALANGTSQFQFVSNTSVFSAIGNTNQVANLQYQAILNPNNYIAKVNTFDPNVIYVARYPGAMGNSLRISVCDSANGFFNSINLASVANGGATVSLNVGSNTANVVVIWNHDGTSQNNALNFVNTATQNLINQLTITDFLLFGNNTIGTEPLQITNVGTYTSNVNSSVAAATFPINLNEDLHLIANQALTATLNNYWEFYSLFGVAPGQSEYVLAYGNGAANDELCVVVVDDGGLFSGVPGTVLEKYQNLSRATDSKALDGTSLYFRNVINHDSQYVYIVNDRVSGYSNTSLNIASVGNTNIQTIRFVYGQDGSDETAISMGDLSAGFDFFKSTENILIDLIMTGKARGGINGEQLANYIDDNICQVRKDCVVFVSPNPTDVINVPGFEVNNLLTYRGFLNDSSYMFLDSGYKYQYDRYNDLYRYVPLNGDMAGLAVRTDVALDPWWAFAGYNRGFIKNVTRLAWNPKQADRDILYPNDINPVIHQPGQGTLLLGDKTLLGNEGSAFSRIGVRRLFITIERAIGISAKYFLFELNDAFTRAQFVNMVTPYMRDIQGRRGVYDFLVVCDGTNNTPEVIDSFTMIADIYVKPERSIDFIKLNFVAVATGTAFSEVIGAFR